MNRKKLSYALKLFLAMVLIMFAAQSVLAGNSNPGIAPVKSSPGGTSYAEWGVEWWQWVLGIPAGENPLLAPDGAYELVDQEHCPFVFLTGTWSPSSEWEVTVKPGTRFYLPTLNILMATAFGDTAYGAEVAVLRGLDPADLTDGELIQLAADHWLDDSTTAITVEIDGEPVEDPNQYRTLSQPFVVEDDALLGGFLTGDTAATAGYAVVLTPLQPGEHTIFVSSSIDPGDTPSFTTDPFDFEVTFHVSVQPGYASACD